MEKNNNTWHIGNIQRMLCSISLTFMERLGNFGPDLSSAIYSWLTLNGLCKILDSLYHLQKNHNSTIWMLWTLNSISMCLAELLL